MDYKKIGDILTKSQYGISIAMNEEGIGYPIYRMNEIHNLLCDLEVDKYADVALKEAKKFILKDGDVLFNRTNSFEWVGRTGIYYKNELDDRDYVFASYLVRFNTNDNIILPEYLNIFLNCKYGVLDIKRRARQSINQTNVNPEEVKEMQIPILSMKLQNRLKEFLISASNKEKKSKGLYYSAENLLISELGLENFNPSNKKVSIKTLKESFLRTGRLDSEYYQPKYDEILNKITKYGCSEFTNFVDSYTAGYPYSSDSYVEKDGIALIKISNINNFKLDISSASLIPKNDIDLSAENVVQKNDILVSMSGTIGNSCIVQDDIKAVVNQRIMKIKSKNINPVVFSLIINSMIGKNQLERIQTGGVQANISPKDILKIQIPCIKTSVQDEIAGYIKQSMEYSKKAKELLEISTKSVEIAIDKDETAAHNFLEQNRTGSNCLL